MSKYRNPLKFSPTGVIPAALLPFHEDLSIDEVAFRSHLRDVASETRISAITVNAHSTEVGSCTFEEQQQVLEVALDEVGDKVPLVNGVYAEGTLEAVRIAGMATRAGAAALLVFPPGPFSMGHRPEMVVEHFSRIADVSDRPLIAFQYAATVGQHYPIETLIKLKEKVPNVVAIKDWIGSPSGHDRQIRVLQHLSSPVNVLTTHSAWLFPSLVLGCAGLLSGSGSVIATLQADLFDAVKRNDLLAARACHDRITPLAEVFYSDPWVDMHNRMKEALVLLGKLPRAVVRPPLMKISAAEIARIRRALIDSHLLD